MPSVVQKRPWANGRSLEIDPEGKVVYTELVPEITQEPNYEAALKAVK